MDARGPLAGRTVLVTGGARRVGAAISRHLGERGARVLVHYHSSDREARELVASLPQGGAAFAADLGAADGPCELFDACEAAGEAPDAIVHGAASFEHRTLFETTASDWDRIFALNLRSLFLLAQELGRRRQGRGGDLVAITDAAGIELWTGYLAHSVAKAGVISLIKVLAKALAPAFRVNGVIPGPVLPPDEASDTEVAAMQARTLLKRLGDPRHVAQAVEFLLTCDYATGSLVEVTGGSQLWRGRT